MLKIKSYLYLFLILFSINQSFSITKLDLEKMTWITEEYPPYNFIKDGVPTGISIDILIEILKEFDYYLDPKSIKVYPWPRGVKTLNTKKNTCLFATTLTSERKHSFGWKFVYPIPQAEKQTKNHLIARKNIQLKFSSIKDIIEFEGRIGAIINDIGENLLNEIDFNKDKQSLSTSPEDLIKKLHLGRYDVISYGHTTTKQIMKRQKINTDLYESVYVFPFKPLGYAFHYQTENDLISKMQKALNKLKSNGHFNKIIKKYTNIPAQ